MSDFENSFDRRMFVKGASVAGLGALASYALSGCAPSDKSEGAAQDVGGLEEDLAQTGDTDRSFIGLADSDVELGDLNVSETRDVDVVVVGSGMAGITATMAAVDEGMSVICLEKRSAIGGTSAAAEGMFGLGSQYQIEQGYTNENPDDYFKMCMDYHHYCSNARIARRFYNTAGSHVDWCMDHGMKLRALLASWSVVPSWHVYDGKGKAVIDTFAAYCESKGAEILTDAPAVQLLDDGNGAVTGVIAKNKEGSYVQISAKAVILAAGGYPCNREMIETYTGTKFYEGEDPVQRDNSYFGTEGRTGDGILMGESIGASLFRIGAVMADFSAIGGTRMDEENVCRNVLLVAPTLIVNESAKRFCSEGLINDFVAWGEMMTTQAKNFQICDYDFVVRQSKGVIADCSGVAQKGTPYPDAVKEIDEYIEAGDLMIYKADTIEELAEKMGLDPATLKDTVDHYNEMCDNKYDEDFCKEEAYLIPVKTAPFYGIETHPMYMTTVGGLRIDERARVLDKPGNPIKGLYAAGSDAGGLYGYSYDVKVACGSQQNFCVASSRWAIEDIKENVLGSGDGHHPAAKDMWMD
ncbi:FAD-dependent oxidoreductase [Adlercreutzia caecimuris]|uniref:FAD-dependent oxidoreductase n=1 Tax=Adlercreutzia caecimuris TaxID=671266 RepID=UPI00272BCD8E|nr:FAD-dependent oxidoreductase [Adlercreutzia caecimuris]